MTSPLQQSTKAGNAAVPARQLAVIYRPIGALTLNPKNPRLHNRRQIRPIARSIQSFGFNVPVLIDAEDKVIAGHGRLLASRELGWSEVPTIRLEHLNEAQKRAFMIADNRLTDTSAWDEVLLAEQLKDLSVLDLDFSLEATGFEMGEIDLRIEGLTVPSRDDDPADAILPDMSRPPVSRAGDLWSLGRHRVHCASALEPGAYAVLMDGEQAGMVLIDPPYNVRIDGHASGLGGIHHREFAMASGEMTSTEFTAFLTRSCALLARHSIDGAIHFICMDWRHTAELLAA